MRQKRKEISMERYEELLRKERYYDVVLSAENGVTSSELAAEFGHSAQWLHTQLENKGIVKKVNDVWLLTSKYANKGYMQTRTMVYSDEENNFHARVVGTWTQAGRAFVWGILFGGADA